MPTLESLSFEDRNGYMNENAERLSVLDLPIDLELHERWVLLQSKPTSF